MTGVMDRAEAAGLLGVDVDASPQEARAAFRTLIRDHHPDRAGPDATDASARLIEAHRVLRTAGPDPAARAEPAGPAGPVAPAGPVDARVAGDSLLVDAEPAVVMARLVEAGHALGEVTYLDRATGIVEVLLQLPDPDDERLVAVSLVASLQGRLDAVEVFCTVERLDGHPSPPIGPIVSALAAEVRLGSGAG